MKWQQRYRVEWDAADGRNGGAQRTVWEILMEILRFKYRAVEKDLGAVALVLDLAKAFERVSLPVAWVWATHFSLPRKILRVPCGYFEHQRGECSLKDVRRNRCGPSLPSCQGQSGVACFYALCCRTRQVRLHKCTLPLKLRVFVDGIPTLLMVKNKLVAAMANKVMKRLREEVEKKA